MVGEDADVVSPEQVIRSVKRAITNRSETFTVVASSDSGPEARDRGPCR